MKSRDQTSVLLSVLASVEISFIFFLTHWIQKLIAKFKQRYKNGLAKPWAFSQGIGSSSKTMGLLIRPKTISQGQTLISQGQNDLGGPEIDIARPKTISQGQKLILQGQKRFCKAKNWSCKAKNDLARPKIDLGGSKIDLARQKLILQGQKSISQGQNRSRKVSQLKGGECNDKQRCTCLTCFAW